MHTREILLRILRLNLIPAPRVITPGPATVFPIMHVDAEDSERVARSLEDARALSKSHPGVSRDKEAKDFFVEILPVQSTAQVAVAGLSSQVSDFDTAVAKTVGTRAAGEAIRAAYALGLDCARVTVGFGPGGPWVIHVDSQAPVEASVPRQESSIRFLGARAEYLAVDLRTGTPFHRFFWADIDPGGEISSVEESTRLSGPDYKWISSPMPYPDMPLSTRLLFRGSPSLRLLRDLDRSAALIGLLVSPVDEVRERNATEEGLLGSFRIIDSDRFEYLSVPGILWNPKAVRKVCELAQAVAVGRRSEEIRETKGPLAGPWTARLDELYKFQRAYYQCDKALLATTAEAVGGAEDLAIRGGVEPAPHEVDFRSAWGIEVPDFAENNLASAPPWESLDWSSEVDIGDAVSIRVGPVIGIMASALPSGPRFGIETDRFKRLILLGSELGLLVYVFFPDNIDWDTGLVSSWTYRDRRGWTSERLPLPDVVYDRHIPEVLQSGDVQDVAGAFQKRYPQAKFVNSLSFVKVCRDKLKAHSALASCLTLKAHLPLTEEATEPSKVARFAAARDRSFLKLRGGTGSKGLALIENSGSSYRITRREKGLPPEIAVVSGTAGLESVVSTLMGEGESPREYIIQEGIDLAELPDGAGNTFEVRVICQKGGAGRWLRTGMVCRLNPTAEKFIVPGEELHRRAGDLLGLVFRGRSDRVKEEIRRIARVVPPVLEQVGGPGGEMSVDLGIDRRGKPWLIEVNSKPATLFRDVGAFELRRLSLIRVLNYAAALFEGRGDK